MSKEVWKDIPGYKGLYQASNLGRIKSLPRTTVNVRNGKRYTRHIKGKIRKPYVHAEDDRVRVSLYKAHGHETNENLAHLIAKTFIPNPHHYNVVLHRNGGSRDNSVENLYWSSKHENHMNYQKRKHVNKVVLVKDDKKKCFASMVQAAKWLKATKHLTTKVPSIRTVLSRNLHKKNPKAYGYRIISHHRNKKRKEPLQLQGEIWKDIPGYERLYQVSNYGRVRRLSRKIKTSGGKVQNYHSRILRLDSSRTYYMVRLSKHNKTHKYQVHRLVAKCFIPNPHHYSCVNHKDENRRNDKASNLEWCTYRYNNNYGDFIKRISRANSYPISLRHDSLVLDFSSIYKAACWLKQHEHLTILPITIRYKLIWSCKQHKPVYGYQANYINHRRKMRNKYTSLI